MTPETQLPWPGVTLLRTDSRCSFFGEREILHVLSRHAGGEVRGYIRPRGGDIWEVRRPAHEGHWPEMDRAVADATGEPIRDLRGQMVRPNRQMALVLLAQGGGS